MPKVSVIVPVYNVEKYLSKCIDSILSQTFTNFELILINDGSKDNSGFICDEYANKDPRIIVIHKENGGASSARNCGLDIAKGEWVAFIDSDDYVTPQLLHNLTSNSNKSTSLIISGIIKTDETGAIIESRTYKHKEIYYTTDFNGLFNKGILQKHKGPCAKLYLHDIISQFNIRFHEDIITGEDVIFNYTYMLHANSILIIDYADYYYKTRSGSLTTLGTFPLHFERRSYHLYKSAISELSAKYKISHPYILELECFFIDNLINAIYNEGINMVQRIAELSNINFDSYAKHKKPYSYKESILKNLLVSKSFRLYDFIRTSWSKFQ